MLRRERIFIAWFGKNNSNRQVGCMETDSLGAESSCGFGGERPLLGRYKATERSHRQFPLQVSRSPFSLHSTHPSMTSTNPSAEAPTASPIESSRNTNPSTIVTAIISSGSRPSGSPCVVGQALHVSSQGISRFPRSSSPIKGKPSLRCSLCTWY